MEKDHFKNFYYFYILSQLELELHVQHQTQEIPSVCGPRKALPYRQPFWKEKRDTYVTTFQSSCPCSHITFTRSYRPLKFSRI